MLCVLVGCYTCLSAQIHVATNGSDNNDGSKSAPLLTIQHAVDIAQPGDTIWVHGGRYVISERIKIPQKQTSEVRRCYLWAAGDGEVIIDGSAMQHTTQNEFKMGRCIYVNHLANYWHFKGLTLCNAEDNGMKVEGSYNIIEQCVFRDNNDTGLQIGMYKDFAIEETKDLPAGEPKFNPGYQFCRGNVVINCDAYNNADLRTYNGTDDGGDADGRLELDNGSLGGGAELAVHLAAVEALFLQLGLHAAHVVALLAVGNGIIGGQRGHGHGQAQHQRHSKGEDADHGLTHGESTSLLYGTNLDWKIRPLLATSIGVPARPAKADWACVSLLLGNAIALQCFFHKYRKLFDHLRWLCYNT